MTLQFPSKQAPWDLTQFSLSPSTALLCPEFHSGSQISSLSKVISVLGKAISHRVQHLGCRGTEPPGWLDVSLKNCMRCDTWTGMLSWWSCQSPVAHTCSLLNHPTTFCEGLFKLNAKFDANSLLYSLNFECDGHRVHMLTQRHLLPTLTSTVKLLLFTHAHSSPLSLAARLHWCHTNHFLYINNGWTFPRLHVYISTLLGFLMS